MAFGKKNDDAQAPAAEESAPLDSAELAPPEAAAEAPAAAAGSDALLSMFQENKDEVNDLAVLVDLAGDPDLDDILEELRTLRAALGITDAYDDEDLADAA